MGWGCGLFGDFLGLDAEASGVGLELVSGFPFP